MKIDINKNKIITSSGNIRSFKYIISKIKIYEDDIIYFGGSLIEGLIDKYACGMGNKYSDLDIFIIRDHNKFEDTECVYDDKVRKTFFVDLPEISLDVEVFDKEYILKIIGVLNTYKPNFNEKVGNIFAKDIKFRNDIESINEFLTRFKNSICVKNVEKYNKLMNDVKFEKFFQIYKDSKLIGLRSIYDDIVGNIDANQVDVALFSVRKAILKVIYFTLYHEKIFCDREKWAVLKFKNLININDKYKDLYDIYYKMYYTDLSSVDKGINDIKVSMNFCKRYCEKILLEDLL